MSIVTQVAFPYESNHEQSLAERLLNIQNDIWRLECEQARLRSLLKIRRAVRQSLARQARVTDRYGA
jgi:hypothetical protein